MTSKDAELSDRLEASPRGPRWEKRIEKNENSNSSPHQIRSTKKVFISVDHDTPRYTELKCNFAIYRYSLVPQAIIFPLAEDHTGSLLGRSGSSVGIETSTVRLSRFPSEPIYTEVVKIKQFRYTPDVNAI
ncbi:uncharacterized protein RSE6_12184 [Rhynchosporium secalis]|uniref:Uncharacterized protein n=1 Tax=Rhynchosporium secalis TaxID=38038 RepID=A0A1E1MPS5_RHYSE|nr:uncharacterized protein RSE6_12184 [Rhynchosporium secalis]